MEVKFNTGASNQSGTISNFCSIGIFGSKCEDGITSHTEKAWATDGTYLTFDVL